jgi:hypothetical protein
VLRHRRALRERVRDEPLPVIEHARLAGIARVQRDAQQRRGSRAAQLTADQQRR